MKCTAQTPRVSCVFRQLGGPSGCVIESAPCLGQINTPEPDGSRPVILLNGPCPSVCLLIRSGFCPFLRSVRSVPRSRNSLFLPEPKLEKRTNAALKLKVNKMDETIIHSTAARATLQGKRGYGIQYSACRMYRDTFGEWQNRHNFR